MEKNTLIIPKGTEVIKEKEYSGMLEYTDVIFPSTLKKIEWAAFSGCENLKVVDLPKGIKEIGSRAFSYVDAVFFIPSTIKLIGEDAFSTGAVIFIECGKYDFMGSLSPTPPSSEHPFAYYGYGDSHFTYDSDNRPPSGEHHYNATHEDFLKYLQTIK